VTLGEASRSNTLWWILGLAGGAAILALLASAKDEIVDAASTAADTITEAFVSAWKWYSRPTSYDLTTLDIWTAVLGTATSTEITRTPAELDTVINQFVPATNQRYTPRVVDGKPSTFCNIFVGDVMRALSVEIPWGHANDVVAYLASDEGQGAGWVEVVGADAQNQANQGRPVVLALAIPGGTGHTAVVRPGNYDAARGPTIANVGTVNFEKGPAVNGLGSTYLARARYFAHA
jgi:hypothetical protein